TAHAAGRTRAPSHRRRPPAARHARSRPASLDAAVRPPARPRAKGPAPEEPARERRAKRPVSQRLLRRDVGGRPHALRGEATPIPNWEARDWSILARIPPPRAPVGPRFAAPIARPPGHTRQADAAPPVRRPAACALHQRPTLLQLP